MRHSDTRTEEWTRSFYDTNSATYDEERWRASGGAFNHCVQRQIFQRLCKDWREKQVLEVGPGTARFSIELLKEGNRLTLADISGAMLEVARGKIEECALSSQVQDFVESSIYDLPFGDGTFDHAICINVFNHLAEPDRALRELARVVRPGSTLLFNYANLHSYYWPVASRINRGNKAVGRDVYSVWERPRDMQRTIEAAGLRLVERVGHVHVPRALESYPIHSLVRLLDGLSRRGPLSWLAAFHFCLCRKGE